MTTAVPCPYCEAAIELAGLLGGISYWRGPGIFVGACPRCAKGLEFRVSANAVEFGYTYWAGSMHFEGMRRHRVGGLRRAETGDSVAVELDGVTYPAPSAG